MNVRRLFLQPENDITVCGAGTLGRGAGGDSGLNWLAEVVRTQRARP